MSIKQLLIFLSRFISTILGILFCFASGTWLMAAWSETHSLTTQIALIGWTTLIIGVLLIWYGLWPRKNTASSSPLVKRILTFQNEVDIAKDRQVVRVTYRDESGDVTKLDLDIYRPRDDVYAYAYCRRQKEPRTFLIEGILDWKVLPQRFTYNPLVDEWFDTFGPSSSEARPNWKVWVHQKRQVLRRKPSVKNWSTEPEE